jgi:hypothetical protein
MHGKFELSFKDIEFGVFRKYAPCIMLDNVVQNSWLRV